MHYAAIMIFKIDRTVIIMIIVLILTIKSFG